MPVPMRKTLNPNQSPWRYELDVLRNEMIDCINTVREDLSSDIEDVDMRVDDHTDRLDNQQLSLDALEATMKVVLPRLERLTEVEERLLGLETKVDALDDRLEDVDMRVDDLSTVLDETRNDLLNLELQADDLADKQDALETETETELDSQHDRLDGLDADIIAAYEQSETLERQVDVHHDRLDDVEARMNALERDAKEGWLESLDKSRVAAEELDDACPECLEQLCVYEPNQPEDSERLEQDGLSGLGKDEWLCPQDCDGNECESCSEGAWDPECLPVPEPDLEEPTSPLSPGLPFPEAKMTLRNNLCRCSTCVPLEPLKTDLQDVLDELMVTIRDCSMAHLSVRAIMTSEAYLRAQAALDDLDLED